MKTKTVILLIITFPFWGLGGFSCSKDNTSTEFVAQLPPETQTGANTFGCLINGKVLIPRNGSGTIGGSDRAVTVWGDVTGAQQYNEIDVRDFKSNRTAQILLHIQNIHQLGTGNYTINLSNGNRGIDGLNHNYIHCRVFNESTNSYQYYRSFEYCGNLIITRYDSPNLFIQNRIFSGNFNCRLKNTVSPFDEIQLTNGRFDINKATIIDKLFP